MILLTRYIRLSEAPSYGLPVEWLSRGKLQPRRDMNHAQLDELAMSIHNRRYYTTDCSSTKWS